MFNGLIVQDGKVKVSLLNPNNGDAKWVQVGKKFGNYTVGFQPGVPGQTADAVVLTLGASSQRIILQGSADLSVASIAAPVAFWISARIAITCADWSIVFGMRSGPASRSTAGSINLCGAGRNRAPSSNAASEIGRE